MSTEQQQILEALDEIKKDLPTLEKSPGNLAALIKTISDASTSLNQKMTKAEEEVKKLRSDANRRMGVAIGFAILLALLPGFVIQCSVTSSQAAVLCCVVICGTLLGIVYLVTGRKKDDDA
jgi:Na+/melibiose symporter-like transporter